MGATGKALTFSLLSLPIRFSFNRRPLYFSIPLYAQSPLQYKVVLHKFRPLCTATTATDSSIDEISTLQPIKHSILLERLRQKHLKDPTPTPSSPSQQFNEGSRKKKSGVVEMSISVPTEIQCIAQRNECSLGFTHQQDSGLSFASCSGMMIEPSWFSIY